MQAWFWRPALPILCARRRSKRETCEQLGRNSAVVFLCLIRTRLRGWRAYAEGPGVGRSWKVRKMEVTTRALWVWQTETENTPKTLVLLCDTDTRINPDNASINQLKWQKQAQPAPHHVVERPKPDLWWWRVCGTPFSLSQLFNRSTSRSPI